MSYYWWESLRPDMLLCGEALETLYEIPQTVDTITLCFRKRPRPQAHHVQYHDRKARVDGKPNPFYIVQQSRQALRTLLREGGPWVTLEYEHKGSTR